jgi:hypothetical protein
MSRTLQFKRYPQSTVAGITGAAGELIIDTTNNILTVHDGVTRGGYSVGVSANTVSVVFNKANTSNIIAQASFDQGNSTLILMQSSFDKANSANVLAQAAFDRANTPGSGQFAFEKANSANVLAQSAFDKANSANVLAQNAYNAANTAAQIVPQNAQTTNYTLVNSDAGKHLYYTQSANVNLYIPWSSNASFANGTTIMIVSRTTSSANVTVTPNTGVTMYLAGNTTSASRNVITYGVATLLQVASNTWMIYGTGVT